MKRILAALVLLTLAAPAWGQDFEKGLRAYEQGDYTEAAKLYRKAAEQGHVTAQFRLGDIVTIASPRFGSLVNRVDRSDRIPPWTFGTSALMRNLAARGLLGRGPLGQ